MLLPSLESIDEVRKRGFRPVVAGCLLFENTILFAHKKEHDVWMIPQGGIDNTETIQAALKREMDEELGTTCTEQIQDNIELILEDEVEFPPAIRGTREMKLDNGKTIFMRGKHYYFVAAPVAAPKINLDESEFNDVQWLTFDEAMKRVKTMNQRGKRRVTERVLKALKEKKML